MAQQGKPAPDERYYPLVFQHILYLQTHDSSVSPDLLKAGTVAPKMSGFFSQRVGMGDTENAALVAEAQAWQADVAPIDNQAYARIRQIRAQTPGGHLAPGATPPPMPEDLKALQVKHDTLTLQHVQHLRALFGPERFTQFDTTIRGLTQGSGAAKTPLAKQQ